VIALNVGPFTNGTLPQRVIVRVHVAVALRMCLFGRVEMEHAILYALLLVLAIVLGVGAGNGDTL